MSAKTFGPHFRPQDFTGPLARHYPEREDLFQQLVGALLRELYSQRAAITATKGRDGGIDGFVEAAEDPQGVFCDLRFLIIVECKDHEDSLGAVTRNVEAGWSRVREKLARQAEVGWKGTYQPWRRAKGYLYCISAVLNQHARDELKESIREFFYRSLPPEQRPPVEAVYVLDWSDLAPLLNRHARLADAWLGTDLEGVVGHNDYEQGLSGFRLYLKEDRLPFIAPTKNDQTHPENLLVSLEQDASTAGILLVGASGVGKTRTCFEVARLADQKGWRVVHLLPGEPPITASGLQEIVLQGCTPTLLVIDYLDQMGSLDFATIRHRLLPEAKARSLPLAILANARPGLLHKRNPERDALFHRIELDIRGRQSQIGAHFQETIAPKASTILGPSRIREICGSRPIIGMFIARELERYAEEGGLDETIVCRLRQGDLQGWIRRRFQEDGLLPQETHPLLPASPDRVMIAAAAGLAAAPLSRPRMSRVICETLAATGTAEATETANALIASLVRSGWLEETSHELTTPHDVIADELLELTLCDRDRCAVRSGVVDRVLTGALAMPRVFGRFSVAVDRVIEQKGFPEQVMQGLRETASTWVFRHASEMGRAFLSADPDEVSYALGAVVTGATWSGAALKAWDDLIAPWLDLYACSGEARHLLYRGLKELPEGRAGIIAHPSCRWLEVHFASLEASYVLAPLLGRQDLGDQAGAAIDAAMAWITEHGIEREAQFVLAPLLGRQDLGDQAGAAIDAAMAWITEHGTEFEANFVFAPLLGRQDLGDQAGAAIDAAMGWLEVHFLTEAAEFVLRNLLRTGCISGDRRQHCLTLALSRLDKVIESTEASFIIRWCLRDRTLSDDQLKSVVERATKWLRAHRDSKQIDFVFKLLLRNPGLEDKIWREVADYALAWLRRTPLASDRDHALNSLLTRLRCLTPEEKAFLIQDVRQWLKEFPNVRDRERLLINAARLTEVGSDQNAPSQLPASMGTQLFPSLSRVLREHLQKGLLPDSTLLHNALETAGALLSHGKPGRAAYYLTSLLPLTSLKGDRTFADQVTNAVQTLLAHPALTTKQRIGFSRALYDILDEGLWPNREEGARVLLSLEIRRPSDV
jgi:hypothetical protein